MCTLTRDAPRRVALGHSWSKDGTEAGPLVPAGGSTSASVVKRLGAVSPSPAPRLRWAVLVLTPPAPPCCPGPLPGHCPLLVLSCRRLAQEWPGCEAEPESQSAPEPSPLAQTRHPQGPRAGAAPGERDGCGVGVAPLLERPGRTSWPGRLGRQLSVPLGPHRGKRHATRCHMASRGPALLTLARWVNLASWPSLSTGSGCPSSP